MLGTPTVRVAFFSDLPRSLIVGSVELNFEFVKNLPGVNGGKIEVGEL